MEIAFFTPTLQIGGYERVVLAYANYIAEIPEMHVFIICANSDGDLRKQISPKINVINLQCRTRNLLFKLAKYFRHYTPDVFYSGFRIYNSIAVLAKKKAKNTSTKIYISQHGFEYQKKYIKNIHASIQQYADGFIAVTESLRTFEQQDLNLKCPSCVIGNPVVSSDREICPVNEMWFEDQLPVICVCGRLSEDKNVDLAVEILKRLHEKEYNVKLLVLGDGPELEHLKTKVKVYNLEKYVRFEGFVNNPIDYMARCSVYLHTCDREGFGNTVVEALYAELPVVTTDCGGPVDIIQNNRYGISFGRGRDVRASEYGADAVISVLEHKQIFVNLRERALLYSVDSVAPKLLKFMIGERLDD